MHNDIIDHIARDSGYNKGYEAGMKRAWDLVGELVEYYRKENDTDTGYVHSNHENEGRYQAALYAQMVIKMNRFNESATESDSCMIQTGDSLPVPRYSHVRDSMYELDDNGTPFNEEYMTISLPADGEWYRTKAGLEDAPTLENYQAETLYLRLDSVTGALYPCTREATNKLQFRLVYDGSWAGTGEEFQSKRMISMTKPELLAIADAAMVYTGNEHHCFLENLRYQRTDNNGIVYLELQFGS